MIGETSKSSHVLLTLGVLFTIGGAVRFLPSGAAVAEEAKPSEPALTALQLEDQSDIIAPSADQSGIEQACFTAEAAEQMMEDQWLFATEQEALNTRQLALDARAVEVSAQIEELRGLQAALEDRWAQMSAASDADLQHLAKMYAAMKPGQAALIFDNMDPAFAAGFLKLIDSEQAGLILASMDARRAYIVSVELANANADIRALADVM